jgi:four helix bundle protein
MTTKIESFTDLIAWKEAHKLTIMVYQITRNFPKEELFALTSQLRRAVVSVAANIAEGFSRRTFPDKKQFFTMALGSLTETQNYFLLARDLGYLSKENFDEVAKQSVLVSKLVNGLVRSCSRRT